jgi:hypothetical protein
MKGGAERRLITRLAIHNFFTNMARSHPVDGSIRLCKAPTQDVSGMCRDDRAPSGCLPFLRLQLAVRLLSRLYASTSATPKVVLRACGFITLSGGWAGDVSRPSRAS